MTTEQIMELIISFAPAIASVIGIVVSCVKMFKQFTTLRNDVKSATDIKEVREQIKAVMVENASLKREIRSLTANVSAKLDKISLGVDKNVQNEKL